MSNYSIIWILAFLLLKPALGSAQIIDTIEAGKENVAYYIANNQNLIYTWEVEDAVIVAGQGTSSVVLNWGFVPGIKQLKVFANSFGSCHSDTSIAYVYLEAKEDVFVPNSFTPNGDGLNDEFRPLLDISTIKSYQLIIYDRWGGIVFEANNPNDFWNGKDNNGNVLNGVFLCTLQIKKLNNKETYIKKLLTIVN